MFANGHEWQEQRRFTLRNLRDFGFGKTSMEALIQEEIEKCVEVLSGEAGKTTQIGLKMNIAILNALWAILTGEKVRFLSSSTNSYISYYIDILIMTLCWYIPRHSTIVF